MAAYFVSLPALGKQTGGSLQVLGQSELNSKIQASFGLHSKAYLKTLRKRKEKGWDIT